jgi:tRNA_anti-like
MTKQKRPWLKRLLVIGLVLVAIAAGVYWYVATEKFSDTKDRKAAFTVNAIDFIREFEKNEGDANKKYKDKIITVNGRVSEIEAADTTMNIKIIDTANNSFIIFAFQEQHLSEPKTVKVGDTVSIKGSFSAGIFSQIMEVVKIDFKRSALNK